VNGSEFVQDTPIISIVDDDQSIRASLDDLVSSLGYVAHTFVSAEQFLESPQIETTSFLISDIQLPGFSGFELQQALLKRGYTTPILFITAYPSAAEELRAISAGAMGILRKPLNNQLLVENIEIALKGPV
jgi:FixJ family two-component response regulator